MTIGSRKPILVLDFDGVIHSYKSGWKGACEIHDGPVDGAMRFIWEASKHFQVNVYSSRSKESGGISAMKEWLGRYFREWSADCTTDDKSDCDDILAAIEWPTSKPPAFLTIDDRAMQFTGDWSAFKPEDLLNFKTWMSLS